MGFLNFGHNFYHRMAPAAFWVEVAFVLVSAVCVKLEEVRLCLRASSVSVDLLRCHFDKERSSQFDCHKPSPGVVLSQLSPFYPQEIQHPASSPLGLLCEVS